MVLAGSFSISTFLFLDRDLLGSSMPFCLAPMESLQEFGQSGTDIADKDHDHGLYFSPQSYDQDLTPLYIKEGDTSIISLTEACQKDS